MVTLHIKRNADMSALQHLTYTIYRPVAEALLDIANGVQLDTATAAELDRLALMYGLVTPQEVRQSRFQSAGYKIDVVLSENFSYDKETL